MIARHVAHERRDHVLGVATWGCRACGTRRPRSPRAHRADIEPSVLEAAGDARKAFEEVSVIQDAAAFTGVRAVRAPGSPRRRSCRDGPHRRRLRTGRRAEKRHRNRSPLRPCTVRSAGRRRRYEDGLALRDHYPRGSFVGLDGRRTNVHLEQPGITTPWSATGSHRSTGSRSATGQSIRLLARPSSGQGSMFLWLRVSRRRSVLFDVPSRASDADDRPREQPDKNADHERQEHGRERHQAAAQDPLTNWNAMEM